MEPISGSLSKPRKQKKRRKGRAKYRFAFKELLEKNGELNGPNGPNGPNGANGANGP
jgi:hypothetical protein